MNIAKKFPPLYECSVCGEAVKVKVVPNSEPIKTFKCGHEGSIIYANPKAILRGTSKMGIANEASFKIRVTVHQLLTWLTGRSV